MLFSPNCGTQSAHAVPVDSRNYEFLVSGSQSGENIAAWFPRVVLVSQPFHSNPPLGSVLLGSGRRSSQVKLTLRIVLPFIQLFYSARCVKTNLKTVAAIYKLKQDIDSLGEQQAEALKTATFVGMTSDEVIEYDTRGEKITEMIRQLRLLQKTQ
jgi:hypothetical protein